jgi:ABC-type lipoprotein release transport system permease subunit
MWYLLAIGQTGLVALLQYPLRSAAVIVCVVALLLPYLAGMGLAKGLEQQAQQSIDHGADLYLSGEHLGRAVPVPVALANDVQKLEGITRVIPRIVARVVLGKNREEAVLVGVRPNHFPVDVSCVEGELPQTSNLNELVIGTDLARRLSLRVGDLVPPFYHSAAGDRLSKVVGIFKPEAPIWQANLILTRFETASAICNQQGLATELLVYCRPGYESSVKAALLRSLSAPDATARFTPRITTRADLQDLLPKGLLHREGIFNLHFLVAFAVGILAILVTSGFGTSERRREIGILKATGWQTDEILLRSLFESLLLGLTGASLALILAWVWLGLFNGYWLASIFLAGADVLPGFRVPFRLTPVPALLGLLVSLVLVLTGTLYSTWRAAIVPPREALR